MEKETETNISFGDYKQTDKKATEKCRYTPPAVPTGTCAYYVSRFTNFMERHPDCLHVPPVYYYGPMIEMGKLTRSEELFINLSTFPTHNAFTGQTDGMRAVEEARKKKMEQDSKSAHQYKRGDKILINDQESSYGFKYCTLFTNQLMPTLTPNGQQWLKKAKMDLQKLMEQGVVNKYYVSVWSKGYNTKNGFYTAGKLDAEAVKKFYTNIELNNVRFQSFAFASHPDAYDPLAMSKLPVHDLIRIMLTPDMKEWLGKETWEQAWTMAKNMSYGQVADASWEKLKKDTAEGIKKAGDKLKGYWNEIF